MSTLLFWQGRNGRNNSNNSNGNGTAAQGAQGAANRSWLHAPDLLLKGHVAYLVKFLGSTTVEQPKGIEVVKEAIRRLQFTQQLRKSETGAKTKKVEITISVDGVAIQEPRTNNILHQFPLHRISYCADDKEAKKYFSFIAKADTNPASTTPNGDVSNGTGGSNSSASTNGSSSANDQHECFVFVSNKLASEITLTIGQAFDLAYRRFLMERGAGAEAVGQEAAKARAQASEMVERVKELAALLPAAELRAWLSKKGISHATDWTHVETESSDLKSGNSIMQDNLLPSSPPVYSNNTHIADLMNTSIDMSTPTKNPSVGTKLEGLLLNSDSDSDFDPRALENDPPAVALASRPRMTPQATSPTQNGLTPPPLLAPPPKATRRSPPQNSANTTPTIQNGSNDLFGSTPFAIPATNHATAPAIIPPMVNNNTSPITPSNTPNYNLSDFSTQPSIFPPNNLPNGNAFSNGGGSGMVGFDPFDTNKFGMMNSTNNYTGISNGFSNPMGNGFSNGLSNGFGNAFPFGDKQSNSAMLDSSFSGFLDKRVSEMKVGNF